MHYLLDISGSPAAFIYQNTIVHPVSLNVYGVILGHCVYGLKGTAIGRFFDHRLYDNTGEIIAVSAERTRDSVTQKPDQSTYLQQAWQILDRIESYVSPWVQPKNEWSSRSLQDALGQ